MHGLKAVSSSMSSYVIVVEPAEQGVQFVQFPRPTSQLPLTLYFITQDGHKLDEIVETDYIYWPYPQLESTAEP